MILQTLRLKNYKNYKTCSLNFNPRFNFLYGDNGNGKTNLLEAVSMLCYTKSFLQNSEPDCVKYNEDNFEISGEFYNASGTKQTVHFSFDKSAIKKDITFNNDAVHRFSSYFGTFPLVVLSPADICLTAGTPHDKRRNFDLLISQVSKIYFDDLKSLTKIIKQKNSLLKDNLAGRKYSEESVYDLLKLWNEKLSEISSRIVLKRIEFVNEFQEYVKNTFVKITGDSIKPVIEYKCDILTDEIENGVAVDALTRFYNEALKAKMQMELIRGLSLVGPHRDNYVFSMIKNDERFDVRGFASQGEHKAFIVALKISEYQYLRDKLYNSSTGDPLILCDDIFSELDSKRTEKIAGLLADLNQVFITTTDPGYLKIISKYINENDITSFRILDGVAEKSSGFQ